MLSQECLLLLHERPHVPLEEHLVCNDTQKPQRRSPDERVAHDNELTIDDKLVDVSKAGKGTRDHLVDEAARTIELDDPRRQPLADPEVHTLKRDDVTEIEEPGGLAADDPFGRKGRRLEVRRDIARQVEAHVNRGGDAGHEADGWHSEVSAR